MPQLSVCIPAYNRPHTLMDLLESISKNDFNDYEIVICEDHSPKRRQIRAVVEEFQAANRDIIVRYFENAQNLGFDGNIRRLLEVASGDYCIFAGDDDVFYDSALRLVHCAIDQYPQIGAITRAYHIVDRFTGKILSESRYYTGDRYFPPGVDSAASFFRRFVFISGLVVKRKNALTLSTNQFDGTLLYQLYLAANLVLDTGGYFISDFIAQNRVGEDHFFGSSEAEKDLFAPKSLTPQHSIHFLQGMLSIARHVEDTRQIDFYDRVVADLAAYSYPFLVLHAAQKRVFWHYARELGKLGFGKHLIYWVYVVLLLVFKQAVLDRIQKVVKSLYKRTPAIGHFYQGVETSAANNQR